ncbi:MAG TPA: ribonuclease D, partial [Syntrophales bacterium]|nr:ribonuclease D [Syntrophales bacterium]
GLKNTKGKLYCSIYAKAEKTIRDARIVALDTEYDSFRYFRDKLCLLQIQTGEKTWLIDPLAGLDLSFLGEVLIDPAVLKILHAGDNDIRILKRDYAFAFRNIFDTHRAASLLGNRELALCKLLEAYLGVTLEKKLQRSRWDLRPLTDEQLEYAALDTVYLPALCRKLDAELREKGLIQQAEQVFAGMTAVTWQPRALDRLAHRKIPGYGSLTLEQKERLRGLFRWRFEKAQAIDRAPFMILSDHHLVGLAKLEVPSLDAMGAEGLLPPEKVQRFGPEILRLFQEA